MYASFGLSTLCNWHMSWTWIFDPVFSAFHFGPFVTFDFERWCYFYGVLFLVLFPVFPIISSLWNYVSSLPSLVCVWSSAFLLEVSFESMFVYLSASQASKFICLSPGLSVCYFLIYFESILSHLCYVQFCFPCLIVGMMLNIIWKLKVNAKSLKFKEQTS